MIGIYKIENKVNGKVYIGQSINIKQRWYNHKRELNGNRHCNEHLQHSWNKYKEESFDFKLIEECNVDDIDEKEIYWINYYNSTNSDIGYNITAGGQGLRGVSWSNEMKEYLSQLRSPEAIFQLDLKGNILERWRSASYAARETGYPISGIMQCLKENGDQYQAYNFIWVYEKKYLDKTFCIQDYINSYIKEKQKVLQYDLYGNLIKTWDTTSELIQKYGLCSSEYKTIWKCLNHTTKSYKGYIYLFENDNLELTDDYLKKCRVDCYKYNIKQFDKYKQYIKTWTIQEIKNSIYKFTTVRKCCTDNLYGYKTDGTAFSYIWEYE